MAFAAATKFKGARAGPYDLAKVSTNGGGADDSERLVYVGNLSYKTKWQELKDHFKQVGEVENARILTEDGTEWGRSRGVGVVRFKTEADAQLAIARLNESELEGRNILVDPWTGSSGKWRQENAANGKGGGGKGGKAGKGKGGGKGVSTRGNEVHGENLVYVGNLSYKVKWQDLKDHMKQAGTVEFCSVLTEDGTEFGKSKGAGCVRFSSEAEMQQAIAMLNESELQGRNILVDLWTSGSKK